MPAMGVAALRRVAVVGPAAIDASEGLGRRCTTRLNERNYPDAAVEASLGCGNPLMVADLRPKQCSTSVPGGIDVLLSARRVGPTGKAYGLI